MKCNKCDGKGWYEDHADSHHADPDNDCYKHDCPVQRQCEECHESGEVDSLNYKYKQFEDPELPF